MLKHRYIKWFFLLLFALIGVGSYYGYVSLFHMVWIGTIWLTITAWGAFDIRAGYFTEVFYSAKDVGHQYISLTFDDGSTSFTPQVLDLLLKHGMKATFFCIGRQIDKYPDILRRIVEEGHTVGNHSYAHANNIGFFSAPRLIGEIEATDQTIRRITGLTTNMYRPPFGVTNPNTAKACRQSGKKVVGWSVRSLDTVIKNKEKILKRITSKIKPGDVVLLHDTSEKTVEVLKQLLVFLDEKGYKSVPVDQLLKIKAYS